MNRLFLFLSIIFLSFSAQGQITTASISGKITDIKGEPVSGATVQAFYLPTGVKYGVLASDDGNFTLSNINSGGPYKLVISFVGFQTQTKENLSFNLGSNSGYNFTLGEDDLTLATIEVKAEKGGLKTGSGMRIGEENIKTLPTLNRSLTDVTRLTPQSSNNSFAGTNFRYNNVTIDGSINNDAIGFSPSNGGSTGSSGMPGSSTRTNSISLDAIQDVQVYIAPYDVKLGNFLGGSINAVTKSGTNQTTGSVYTFGRNATITGPNNAGDKAAIPSEYRDYQVGFRVGFPIIKDKLFFFTNEEITRRTEPLFYGAGYKDANGKNLALIDPTTAKQISDFAATKYNFNVGSSDKYSIYANSNKFFNRLDWNINDKNQLSIRNNTTMGEATNLERDAQFFRFSSVDFKQTNIQSSTVAELKSRFGTSASNSFVIGYSTVHDYRTPLSTNAYFPQTEIAYNGGTILLGNDREATVFNLRQNTFEISDNFTWFKGKHTISLGTHNELYGINYGFVNSWNGRVAYRSVDEFLAGKVNRVRGSYSFGDNTRDNLYGNPYAKFNVNLFSLYGQDEIQVTDRLRVTAGLRFDLANVPTAPSISPKTQATPIDANAGTTFTNTPLSKITGKLFGQVLTSPRFGFNYDVNGDRSVIIRGGSGVFTGRIPFAWLGYAFYNDGKGFGSFDINNLATKAGVVGDVLKDGAKEFALTNGQALQTQVDLIDNNFKLPQVWRTSLATEFNFSGYKLTLEGMYTKVIRDLKFQQVNLKDSVKYFSYDTEKQQPIYLSGGASGQKVNTAFSNAYMLTNTNQGYRYSLTAQLAKQFASGLNFSVAYNNGASYDISNGVRNSMESNWQMNQSLTPNNPKLTYSNFDTRHRVVATLGYKRDWNIKHTTYFSTVFTTQSGSPFSWGFVNANLANTPQAAGLAYVFRDVAEATKYMVDFKDASGKTVTAAEQAQQFINFVDADEYLKTRKGNFTERNGGRTPWNTTMDVRLMHDIHLKGKNMFQITLDVINFTNLLNAEWGRAYFVPNTFNSTSSIGLSRANSGTAADPTYRFVTPVTPYSIDQLSSRYQAQIGLRYIF
jgi:hypothetical protein